MLELSKIKVSPFSKVASWAFLSITPEYRTFRKLQKKNIDKKPTFEKLKSLPLKFVTIDDVKVRYAHGGQLDKPTILLLSPLPQSIVAFAAIWEKLAENYHVYALDLPGFGLSEGGKEYMTFEKQGVFLDKFIKHFKIQKPHIVGPDVGMAAALYYACNLPNEIESLIIGDGPGVKPSRNGSIIKKLVNSTFWRKGFSILGSEVFVFAAMNIAYINYYPNQEEVDDYIASYKNRISTSTEWFKNYPESLETVDSKIGKLEKPVLIFWGDHDKYLLPENAKELQNRLKHSKTHIFEDCGHFSYQDKYDEFSEMILKWISNDYQSRIG